MLLLRFRLTKKNGDDNNTKKEEKKVCHLFVIELATSNSIGKPSLLFGRTKLISPFLVKLSSCLFLSLSNSCLLSFIVFQAMMLPAIKRVSKQEQWLLNAKQCQSNQANSGFLWWLQVETHRLIFAAKLLTSATCFVGGNKAKRNRNINKGRQGSSCDCR